MTSTRVINNSKELTIAETTVRVWAELLADLVANIDMRVSVKPSDWLDTRVKRTSTGQQTITKKFVNRAEALAQNICRNHPPFLPFFRMLKGNLMLTLKTSTEAFKQFTDKGEPPKSKTLWTSSLIIKFQWQFHTKRILRTCSQDIGYSSKEREKCRPFTSASCEPKSRKW